MSKCCGDSNAGAKGADWPCEAFGWFDDMVSHCLDYATEAKASGRPVVGIMCEYTPRELILAAGGVPACLCGGSAGVGGPAGEQTPPNLCPPVKSTHGYPRQKTKPLLALAALGGAGNTRGGEKKKHALKGGTRPSDAL
ncbi:MAG: hypothetical protein H8E53_00510, partial [Planctomycetes bacterium]|nr:hypothetical protein [Planctomycetota bacterium]